MSLQEQGSYVARLPRAQKHAHTPSDLEGSRCWWGTRRHVNAIAAWLVHSGKATMQDAGQRAVEMIQAAEGASR